MNQPPIRQFTPEAPSGPGQYPVDQDLLVPYFRKVLSLVNEFLIAGGQPAKLKSGRELALNTEWGYIANNGVYVIEIQTDSFPAYCYTPIGQCSPLAFTSLSSQAFESVVKKLGLREMDKRWGQGGGLYYWVDQNENPDPNAAPEFIGRHQVDYPSLVMRWNRIRQGLSS